MKTLEYSNGDKMPIFGLGTWKSQPGEVYNAVKEAIKAGYRHIDCAPIYGNEKEVGKALSECFEEGIVNREQIWVTSKLWNDSHAKDDVEPALKQTLEDLQLDYLDLYLMHWPVALQKGVNMPKGSDDFISLSEIPLGETWKAMEQLKDKGLARHIGVSNFNIDNLKTIMDGAESKPEMNQIELHPYLQQEKVVDYCKKHGLHLTAYSPLGSNDRPDAMKADNEPLLMEDPTIVNIAAQKEVSPAQVLIAWSINRGVAVIPKSVNVQRIKENLEAAEVELNDQEMDEISRRDKELRYVTGEFWAMEDSPYSMDELWG